MVERRFADGRVGAAERRGTHEVQSRTAASSLLDAADLLMGAGAFRQLPAHRLPVLLLHPDSSPFLPMAVAADLLEVLPDARCRFSPAPARHRAQPCGGGRTGVPRIRRRLSRRPEAASLPPRGETRGARGEHGAVGRAGGNMSMEVAFGSWGQFNRTAKQHDSAQLCKALKREIKNP